MGMIRVSDYAEEKIKRMAAESGRTVTSTVDTLVDGNSGGVDLIVAFDKKFDELKGFIADNLVDVVAGINKGAQKTILKWAVVRELFYEKLDWDSEEWCSERMCEMAHEKEGLDLEEWYIEDGFLKSNWPGEKAPSVWLKVSPEVEKFLEDKMKG